MDLWTEMNLGAEWGLDLVDQQNGLFGDLKATSRLGGDMDPARTSGDAVEQIVSSPYSEGALDHDWMESSDLSSFLESLDNIQDELPPQENSLFDSSQELALKDNNADNQSISAANQVKSLSTQFIIHDGTPFVITPPESPEQVAPVIKLDPELNSSIWSSESPIESITPPLSCDNSPLSTQDLIYTDPQIHDSFLEIVSQPELFVDSEIGLVFTSDFDSVFIENESLKQDLELNCTSPDQSATNPIPSPAETSKPSIDTLIQSSPELYKVIATPSHVSGRFSPYVVADQDESKGSKIKRGKRSSELIPEVITSNLGKKERKKVQNKNAAIRYRQKKRVEVENIIGEVQGLENRNQDLKSSVDDLQREIKYMKNLMEEIYKAKGLVK